MTTTWTAADPVAAAEARRFVVPAATHRVGEAVVRSRVVLTGIVSRVTPQRWVGGPVLEVELRDHTGTVGLAFFGRHAIGGVTPGALVTVAGTVGCHDGRLMMLNPTLWLPGQASGPFARPGRSGTGVPLEQRVVAAAPADPVGVVLAIPQPGERSHTHG